MTDESDSPGSGSAETDVIAGTDVAETALAESGLAESGLAETDLTEGEVPEAGATDLNTSDTVDATLVALAPRSRVFALLLPAVALLTAACAAFLGWKYASSRDAQSAAADSVAAARDTTVAILSYRPDSAGTELIAARERLTGSFLDSYTTLINNVVIPGAKEKHITAVAEVPAAASVSATAKHAVALVFVDQSVTEGAGAPSHTNWSVRVTLDKVDGRWLVAGFDPV